MFDLRVDDNPQPVQELKRLVRLQRAYAHANHGDELMTEQKVDEALKESEASSKIAPEIQELPFWHAVTLASVGREKEAEPIFRAVFAKEPQWMELLTRLPAAGLMPNDPALIKRILALGPPAEVGGLRPHRGVVRLRASATSSCESSITHVASCASRLRTGVGMSGPSPAKTRA